MRALGFWLVLLFQGIGLGIAWADTPSIDLICAPIIDPGNSDKDPVVKTTVQYSNGRWQISHTTASGHIYRREDQYSISDVSRAVSYSWSGVSRIHPYIKLIGVVLWNDGAFHYAEALYDTSVSRNVERVMNFLCAVRQSSRPEAMAELGARASSPSIAAPQALAQPPVAASIALDAPAPTDSFVAELRTEAPGMYEIDITSKLDNVQVAALQFNRGNCAPNATGTFPIPLVFGQVLRVRWFIQCKPIEVRLETSAGFSTLTLEP